MEWIVAARAASALARGIARAAGRLVIRLVLLLAVAAGILWLAGAIGGKAHEEAQEKARRMLKEQADRFSVMLDGAEVDPTKIDLSKYDIEIDAESGTVTLGEKKFGAEDAARKLGEFISGGNKHGTKE